jgi:hypothetical protein
MAYVKSICKEEAVNHLLARMRKDLLNYYEDMGNIFEYF